MTDRKRQRGSGGIRQRGKDSWEINYYAPYSVTGERRKFFETVKGTKTDAKNRLSELSGEIVSGDHIAPTADTVADFARNWIDNFASNPDKSRKTVERYRELIDGHIIPGLGGKLLRNLTAEHIEAFYRAKRSDGRLDGRGGLSERTLLHIHRRIVEILDSARRKKKIKANIALDIDASSRPRPKKAKIEVLTDSQMQALLAALEGTRIYAPALLAATTGMRRGEILGLRWSDVDLGAGLLTVAQALEQTKDGIAFKGPKSESSERQITLPVVTIEALRAHKAKQAKERLALGLGKSETDLVFTRWNGDVINPRNFSKEFQRMATNAGFPAFTLHGWRHSHATSLLNNGVNVKVVSARLGHSTIAITLDIYGHVLEEQETDVAERIDNIFSGKV